MRKNIFCCIICDSEFSFPTKSKTWPKCPFCNAPSEDVINIDDEEHDNFKPTPKKIRVQYM